MGTGGKRSKDDRASKALLATAFGASAVLLTVIQPPFGLDRLAWIALVPFILICKPDVKLSRLCGAAYVVGLVYWLGNLYWLVIVTWPGWAALCGYLAVYWPAVAAGLRYCRRKNIPLVAAAPVLFVGAEALQGWMFTGFGWRYLAHSQYANTTIIQIADIFGAAGVSFLVALVNAAAAAVIITARRRKLISAGNFARAAVAVAAVTSAVLYGNWRIEQTEKLARPGPMAAAVQTNFPQEVKRSPHSADEIFNQLITNSTAAAEAGAELIVWPETMVQATLNSEVRSWIDENHYWNVAHKKVSRHAEDKQVYLLVGAHGGLAEVQGENVILAERYNSAYLYRPDSTQGPRRYDKIHLVPFGEFVPFKKSLPWLFNQLMKLTPYNFDYSLTAGSQYTAFEMVTETDRYRFGVLICYEDTTPEVARNYTLDEAGEKRIDWLVNISNDGWFVWHKDGEVLASTELVQHAAICVFRALENRVAVLRSVNTGVSCLVDSAGRIRNGFVAADGQMPEQALKRTAMPGWFLDRIPIDERISFFSKYGRWLDFCCGVCFAALVLGLFSWKFIAGRKRKSDLHTG